MQGGVVASCDVRCVSIVAVVLCLSTVGCCQEAPHSEGTWPQRREWRGRSGWGWCGHDNYRINSHLRTGNGQYSRLLVSATIIFIFFMSASFQNVCGVLCFPFKNAAGLIWPLCCSPVKLMLSCTLAVDGAEQLLTQTCGSENLLNTVTTTLL